MNERGLVGLFLISACIISALLALDNVFGVVAEYQTIFVGVPTVVAAAMTIAEIRRQIATSITATRSEKDDKAGAARSLLALELNKLSEYCRITQDYLVRIIKEHGDNIPEILEPNGLKPEDLPVILMLLENGSAADRKALSPLLSALQVQQSRLNSLRSDVQLFQDSTVIGSRKSFALSALRDVTRLKVLTAKTYGRADRPFAEGVQLVSDSEILKDLEFSDPGFTANLDADSRQELLGSAT